MIALGLKNYAKSFRSFFVPLGALSLGIVAGLSIMLPLFVSAIKGFVSGVASLVGSISLDWGAVKETLLAALRDLDWANPQDIPNLVFTQEYLGDLLKRCAIAALGDTSEISAQMEKLLSDAVSKMMLGVFAFVGLTLVGAFVGYFVTRAEIRRGIAKRGMGRALLVSVVRAVLNVTIIAAGAWLIMKTKSYAILSFILTVLVYGATAFFEAYLVHGYKKVPFKTVMSVKNFFSLAILTLIELAVLVGIILLLFFVTNVVIALYVGYSVLILTMICLQLNAEAYVKSLADKRDGKPIEEKDLAAAYASLAPTLRSVDAEAAGELLPDTPSSDPMEAEDALSKDDLPSSPIENTDIPVEEVEIEAENDQKTL